MKNSHFKKLSLVALAIILLGAGCASSSPSIKVTDTANTPPAKPINDTPSSVQTNTPTQQVQTQTATNPVTKTPTTPVVTTPPPTPKPVAIVYNMAEVAKHNNTNDCWQVIDGNVYNVTSYIPYHPAGPEAIIRFCGKDSTGIFNMKHSPDKKQQLTQYFVAKLQ